MRSAQKVIDDVRRELLNTGADKIAHRRETIAQLARVRANWPGIDWPLRSRAGAVFTMDQTRMLKAHRSLSLKLLVLGHHVADVVFFPDAQRSPEVRVRRDKRLDGIYAPEAPMRWSGHSGDAARLRAFIEACHKRLPSRTPELQVQLQLVRRMAGPKRDSAELSNLQPVMPFGFFTEIATVVNLQQRAATGNIDILARTAAGRAGGQFVVLEVKKPGKSTTKAVAEAFEQAIGYAAALTYEANGFEKELVPQHIDYRRFLADEPRTKANYSNKPLVVHAAVVLPEVCRDAAKHVLERLQLVHTTPQARDTSMSVGALLYDASKRENGWELGAVRWLEHAGSWCPRPRTARRSRVGRD